MASNSGLSNQVDQRTDDVGRVIAGQAIGVGSDLAWEKVPNQVIPCRAIKSILPPVHFSSLCEIGGSEPHGHSHF